MIKVGLFCLWHSAAIEPQQLILWAQHTNQPIGNETAGNESGKQETAGNESGKQETAGNESEKKSEKTVVKETVVNKAA